MHALRAALLLFGLAACGPDLPTTATAARGAATCPAQPCAGNAWHIPAGAEPAIPTMRAPLDPIPALRPVSIFSGNQFRGGGGNPGQVVEAQSALFFRVNRSAWSSTPLALSSENGNNRYYLATLPGAPAGAFVEYYLAIAYGDHPTSFVFGDDLASNTTLTEAAAQASPFGYTVDVPLTPGGAFREHSRGAWQARIYPDSGHLALSGLNRDGAPVEIVFAPPLARVANRWLRIGPVLSSTPTADGFDLTLQLGPGTVRARLSLPSEGVLDFEVSDWGGASADELRLEAASDPSEHFYGFGEKFNALDQSGKRVRIMTNDAPGPKGDQSYKVAPWFLSTRGYGFYLGSTAETFFDLRLAAPDRIRIEQHLPGLRFSLIGGPELTTALSRYTSLTGRPPVPPPWVFAPWISSDIWRTGGEVRYVAQTYRALDLPGSVFVFDSPWESAYNDLRWNETQFAQPGTYEGQSYAGFASAREMLRFLGERGFKVILWITPFINLTSNDEGVAGQNLGRAAGYDEAAANGYLVRASPGGPPLEVDWWKGHGSPVDFTSSAARSWFQGRLMRLVTEGDGVIGGFKTDDGEADFIPLDAAYSDGRRGAEMQNGFALEYHRAVWQVLGTAGVLFARSGFAGTQAFPACWAGDNEPNFGADNGLPSVIVAGLSAAMSGYAIWGHDVGGYQDTNFSASPEDLFTRWAQFGALSPIMQMHRQVGAGRQYPWSYGAAALANYRRYAKLHLSLFPYLYTLAKEAAETGIPILRPLPLLYPDDPAVLGVEHTYQLGRDLLVAPIISSQATARDLYLPAGEWLDLFSLDRFNGRALAHWSSTDPERMPLFLRAGGIVPLIAEDIDTLLSTAIGPDLVAPDGALSFLVAPSGQSSFTAYDGTTLAVRDEPGRTSLTLDSIPRSIELRVVRVAPELVTADGVEIVHAASAADWQSAARSWIADGGWIRIKLDHRGGNSEVVLADQRIPATDAGSDDGSSMDRTIDFGDAGAPDAIGVDAGALPIADKGCSCQVRSGTAHSPAGALLGLLWVTWCLRRPGRRRGTRP